MVRSISSVRPTSGSILPSRAAALRSVANSTSASPLASPPSSVPLPDSSSAGAGSSSPVLAMPCER